MNLEKLENEDGIHDFQTPLKKQSTECTSMKKCEEQLLCTIDEVESVQESQVENAKPICSQRQFKSPKRRKKNRIGKTPAEKINWT